MDDTLKLVKSLSLSIKNKTKLYEEIERVIKPTDEARSKNAEILTPISLAQEMIDKIPDKFWSEPKQVFEPTCGKGVFLCLAYEKFLNAGIEKQTILENCLYFADLNPVNVYICKLLLDPLNEYNLNYHVGDTLKLDITNEFKVEKFDLVLGNPPYNKEWWAKFVKYSLKVLIIDGYLLFVHPCNWRKPEHKIGSIMKSYDILYLKMYNIKKTSKIFKCNVRVDWYLLKKSKTNAVTEINDDNDCIYKISIKNAAFIPNNHLGIVYKVASKHGVPKLNVVRSHSIISNSKKLKLKKTEDFKYGVLTNLNSKGKRIKYIDTPHEIYNKPKVLMSYSLNLYPFYDECLSPTEHTFYHIVKNKDDGENLIKYFDSKLFKVLLQSSKWIGYQTDHKIFKYFPNVISIIPEINDNALFNYFELTNEEIQMIR